MNHHWKENAPEGEVFEDAWGNESTQRESCYFCFGKGEYYNETCCTCGGFGWVCVEVEEDK